MNEDAAKALYKPAARHRTCRFAAHVSCCGRVGKYYMYVIFMPHRRSYAMRRVSLDQIHEDDFLARPLYDIDGRRLLNAGVRLSPSIVQRLREKGVTSVYIDDELSEDVEIQGVLSDETRNRAKMTIRNEMNRLAGKGELDYGAVSKSVEQIMDEMMSARIDVLNPNDIRTQDELVYAHSINVCVMAIALANKLSLPPSKVKSIAMGAILHDIGKALLPRDLLNKKDPSPEEQAEIKKHPLLGYNAIKDISEASATAKISVLMHHEQINGGGYPMGLNGDYIHYSARVVSICDAYDQVINDERYRNVYQTTDAVEYLIGGSGHIFDKSLVDMFMKVVPIYPEGTIVLLSNGTFAIVVKNNPVYMTRPVVRPFYNPKTGIKYDRSYIIDLQHELSIKIVREININRKDIR